MTKDAGRKRILVIDRQKYWRGLWVRSLRKEGYVVRALGRYEYPPTILDDGSRPPDLVILGCTIVGTEELQLIERLLDRKQRLLVSCTSLQWKTMRSLFLAGAEDVTDRTSEPDHLVALVETALAHPISHKPDNKSEQVGGR
jgi:DNA-binding response OmpR family regulator